METDGRRAGNTDDGAGLYARLLGDSWNALHPTVREAHAFGRRFVATGHGSVVHGRARIARLIARVLSLPAENAGAQVELVVERRGDGETWDRTLGSKRLVTRQRPGPDRLLIETFGPLEFRFRLTVVGAGIRFSQRRCGVRIGRLSLRLPAWMSPRVDAYERAHDARRDGWFRVDVNIAVPIAGLLFAYEGELEADKERTWK